LVWGDKQDQRVLIPNVIATADRQRPYFEPEKDPLSGLHVSINSGALQNVRGMHYVGQLAAQAEDKEEVPAAAKKSESDQHYIVLLTSLAYLAVKLAKEQGHGSDEIEATFSLGASLSINECKDVKSRKRFKERLTGFHQIEFLQTPGLEDVKVKLQIQDAKVGLEGVPALMALTTNPNGSMKNEEVANSAVMVADIGGGSMDIPIITPDGVMNTFTDGDDIGTNHYLDKIIEDIAIKKNIQLKSRGQLLRYLLQGKYEISYKGHKYNIKDIIDQHLGSLAQKTYKAIDKQWSKMPEVDYCYLVGGGSVVLSPYIKQVNEAPGTNTLPIRFCHPVSESIWLNAIGNRRVAEAVFGHETDE